MIFINTQEEIQTLLESLDARVSQYVLCIVYWSHFGPCPKCDCSGYCDVNCVGDNCKIVRNGNASSCACTSGDDDATTSGSCSITCPGGCKAIANNGQCYCLCNGNDGDDVCVIDCPPQCTVTRDRFGKCQCVCF
ncbi:spider silk-constituting element SpiCE-NMa2A1 [Trichonephila clavipes]|uniref:Spider silk-constituting element SpiCE-NMa2A1 n=1 Tax=Trichonephila clavipes TaxID=2585209 RepID=A0A8X6WFT9_TRICX|nr:spider silk-constituting element SpiCE-NMa2A1 [Trichonephila clavipes]